MGTSLQPRQVPSKYETTYVVLQKMCDTVQNAQQRSLNVLDLRFLDLSTGTF